MKDYYQVGILKKQCVVAAQCDFTKEREFAMWICNNGQKVIVGKERIEKCLRKSNLITFHKKHTLRIHSIYIENRFN